MSDMEVLSPSVIATPTGLSFPDGITFEEWQDVGNKLLALRGRVHWWIGDWLNYGERRWGEQYSQAIEETHYAYQTLANDKFIASRFDISRRREKLHWYHHAEVAGLSIEQQDRLLDAAEQMQLKRGTFREEVAKYKQALLDVTNLREQLKNHPKMQNYDTDKTARYNAWMKQGEEFFT